MFVLRKRKRLSTSYEQFRNILLVIAAFLCLLPPPSTEATFRLCGFRLTMTLTAICKNQLCGGYFVPTRKRSDTSLLLEDEIDWQQPQMDNIFDNVEAEDQSIVEGGSAKSNHRFKRFSSISKRSGIATECCEKRCSLAYLRTYCCAGFQLAAPRQPKPAEKSKPPQPLADEPSLITNF